MAHSLYTLRYLEVIVTGFEALVPDSEKYGLAVTDDVGTFTWQSTGDILLDKWCNGVSKSIDIRRGGRFCSLSGGSVYLDNCSGLYEFIRESGISLEGSKIELRVVGWPPATVCTGVVVGIDLNRGDITISYDEPSKYRNAIISKLTDDGETYYPAVLGNMDKAKYVTTKKVEWLSDELFMCYFALWANHGNTIAIYAASEAQWQIVVDMRDEIISSGNYYLYCHKNTGEGIAWRISRIYITSITNPKRVDVELGEHCEVGELNDKGRSEAEFFPLLFSFNGSQRVAPSDYDKISYFKIGKVSNNVALDSWERMAPPPNQDIYTHGDAEYLKVNNTGKNGISWQDGKPTMRPERYVDHFNGVENFVFLRGSNFAPDSDYLSGNYDKEVYDPPLSPPDIPWRWRRCYPRNPIGYEPVVFRYVPESWGSSVSLFPHMFMNGAAIDDVFANTHDPKVIISLDGAAPNSNNTFCLPFTFEVEVPKGVEDIILTYDIYTRIKPSNGYTYDELRAMMTRGAYYRYRVVLGLEDDTAFIPNEPPLNHPFDTIEFLSKMDGADGIKDICTHKLNTCYNLGGFVDLGWSADADSDVWRYDTKQGALQRNGNFWRQDLYEVKEFIATDADDRPIQHVVGYKAVSAAGGEINIANRLSSAASGGGGGKLKFRMLIECSSYGTSGNDIECDQEIEIRCIQCLAKTKTDISNIYGASGGREVWASSSYLSFPQQIYTWNTAYDLAVKLQDYSTSCIAEFSRPNDGWGTDYCTGTGTEDIRIYDKVSKVDGITGDYWGINNRSPVPLVRRQLFTASELETKNIKEELLRTAWHGGYIDRDGRECVFDMLTDPHPEERAGISYKEVIPGTLGKISGISKSDVFCEPFLRYNYDIGSDSFTGAIRVMRTDFETFDADAPERYVSGGNLTFTQRRTLWDKGRSLCKRYGGAVNTPPQNLTENKWIYRDIDAYQYLLNWFDWMGEGEESFERREVSFSLPLGVALEKEIDLGRGIDIEIPYMQSTFVGLVTSVSWQFDRGREEARCKAFIKMPVLPYGTIDVIEETGDAIDVIDESGDRADVINEVAQ